MCSDTWTCTSSLGLCRVVSTYRSDNTFLKLISSPWGSSLCITVSPGWSMQQNCDSPSVLFNRKRGRLKENRALSIHHVLPVHSCDSAAIPERIHVCASVVWHLHLILLQNEVLRAQTHGGHTASACDMMLVRPLHLCCCAYTPFPCNNTSSNKHIC